MDSGNQKRRRVLRRAKGLLVLAGILLAVLLCLYVLWERGPERRLARLRAAGYPTSLAEWAEFHRLPVGEPNAADAYDKAFGLVACRHDDPNIPVIGLRTLPERGRKWPEPMLEAVSDLLTRNEPCMVLFHRGASIESCWYAWAESLTTLPFFGPLRDCVRLLELEMLCHAQRGDVEAVIRSCRSMLSLANSLDLAPTMLLYAARMSLLRASFTGLEWTLNTVLFTDAQLRELDGMVAQTAATLDLTEVLISERCATIDIYRDPQLRSTFVSGGRVLDIPGAMRLGLLDALDYMAEVIEASKLPPVERLSRLRAIDVELQGLGFWHFVAKRNTPAVTRVAELDLRLRAQIDLVRTALAIERYRLATGDVPERLEDLVSAYLDAVPLDPFDAQPLRYRRTEPGYRLYSIMEDAQDNHGLERDEVSKGDPYDLCFIQVR